MRIDEFEFQDRNGNEIEPTKNQLVVYIKSLHKQIAELQKQLKEEEKEIEQLKKFDDLNKTFFDLFRTAFKKPNKVDDLFNALKTMQEKQDQDKISFAVEQLEKLKVELHTIHTNGYLKAIDEEIDNQINELKGKVKNEQREK